MGDSKYNPAEIDKENRELDEFYGSRKKVRWSLQEIIEKYGPTYKKLKDYISGQKHPTESNNLSGIREEYDEKDCD